MKLTQRKIENLECPPGRRDMMVFDDEQAGLGVRVTASGGKSFLAQYTLAGAKRRVPLGSCNAIPLASAREAARAILGDVAKGRDPAHDRVQKAVEAKRKAARDILTLDALIGQWAALRLADRRASYAAEAVRALRLCLRQEIERARRRLEASRRGAGARRHGQERQVAMASEYGGLRARLLPVGCEARIDLRKSVRQLAVGPVEKRDRVLSDEELSAVWKATDRPGPYNAIVRTLVLTGQRREEVAGMTWAELDDNLSIVDDPGEPREEWRRPRRPAFGPGAGAVARRPPPRRKRPRLPGPSRSLQRVRQRQGAVGQGERRRGSAIARHSQDHGDGPPKARRSARSHRGRSEPRRRKPRRHRRHLSAPRLRGREARRARRLGRARGGDVEGREPPAM